MPGLKDRLTDAGYGLGWSVVCRLPELWAQSAFRFRRPRVAPGPGVPVLEGNLRRVIGSEASDGQLRLSGGHALLRAVRPGLPLAVMAVTGRGMRDLGMSGPRSSTSRPGAGDLACRMGSYDLAGAWVIAKGRHYHRSGAAEAGSVYGFARSARASAWRCCLPARDGQFRHLAAAAGP
jgi:hypothetical protein